jgi:hypothetical protein
MPMNAMREMLRHALATLAYRGAKVLRGAPPGFAEFRASEKTRTPGELVAHLGDLLDWAWYLAKGQKGGRNTEPLAWEAGSDRFFAMLERLDGLLAIDESLACDEGKLFQGPIADALTHVGQIAMLRRMAGRPVRGENYFRADIQVGRVGKSQADPKVEFD